MPKSMKVMLIIFAVIVGTIFLWLAKPANAMSYCGQYADFVKALNDKYHETSSGKGMSGGGSVVVEIFKSKETFTILATIIATGKTCIIAAGKGWAAADPEISGVPL